tara:strand:- start:178659 stop:179717 length:1059 start_codon:yes stop_codon:yes gene_type:complete
MNTLDKRVQDILKANAIYTITDIVGKIEYANEKFCDILDFNADMLVGEFLQLFKSETPSIDNDKNLWRAISQGEKWSGDLTHKLKNGKSVWLKTTIFPIKDDRASDYKFLSIYEDVTELKSGNEKLKNELELFLYRSAHDLNAPFSSAQGLINLIKEEQSIEKVQTLIGMLEKTINHAKVLSDGLSSASQISTRSKQLKVIDFSHIVNSVLKMLSSNAKYENIKFNVEIQNTEGFMSNPELLFAIFKNLIQNAIKYSLPPSEHHKPYIAVNVTTIADELTITICDNGKGIAEKEFDKIFELYYRAEKEHNMGSNGLGLYIVKNGVESLKGKIKVESKINKGACFAIYLPKAI